MLSIVSFFFTVAHWIMYVGLPIIVCVGLPIFIICKIVSWIKFTIKHPAEGISRAVCFIVKAFVIGVVVAIFSSIIIAVLGVIALFASAAAANKSQLDSLNSSFDV